MFYKVNIGLCIDFLEICIGHNVPKSAAAVAPARAQKIYELVAMKRNGNNQEFFEDGKRYWLLIYNQ